MALSRREFLQMMVAASACGVWTPKDSSAAGGMEKAPGIINTSLPGDVYNIPKYGNVSLMHFTDCHAQLIPTYYREPDIHIGVGKLMIVGMQNCWQLTPNTTADHQGYIQRIMQNLTYRTLLRLMHRSRIVFSFNANTTL